MSQAPHQEHPPAGRGLTIARVARLLGVRKWLVRKWVASEELPLCSTKGGVLRIDENTLHAHRVALVPRPTDMETERSAEQ